MTTIAVLPVKRLGEAKQRLGDRLSPGTRRMLAESMATDVLIALRRAKRVDGTVVVRGTDDGVGVSEAELARLFERFFRADRARASRGTGLGLAIVKHIVTQSGGTVEARGGRGRGLEIRCSYPVA